MKKYKVTVTVELIEADATSNFGTTLLEKINKENAEIKRILSNNLSIISFMKEYMKPFIKEINSELKPLGLGIFHPGSEYYNEKLNQFNLSHIFAVTTDNMVHFSGILPYRERMIGQKQIREIIGTDIQMISFVSYGAKYKFSDVKTMLELHSNQIEKSYREKIAYDEYLKMKK